MGRFAIIWKIPLITVAVITFPKRRGKLVDLFCGSQWGQTDPCGGMAAFVDRRSGNFPGKAYVRKYVTSNDMPSYRGV